MTELLESSWRDVLKAEFEKPYFKTLELFVSSEYERNVCFPPIGKIFAAFDKCHFDDVRVVIIGQDPYHGINQANGLCFSVNDGIPFPPSLRNIFEEIRRDIGNPIPQNGNLERWANQGILMLNATLTVREGEAGSHQKKGWEIFTDAVIEKISSEKENVVFLLWGGFAKKKCAIADRTKHYILESGHPSPLSANRGFWFGRNHFSTTNKYLEEIGSTPISW